MKKESFWDSNLWSKIKFYSFWPLLTLWFLIQTAQIVLAILVIAKKMQ